MTILDKGESIDLYNESTGEILHGVVERVYDERKRIIYFGGKAFGSIRIEDDGLITVFGIWRRNA